jgi:hypothetical protein
MLRVPYDYEATLRSVTDCDETILSLEVPRIENCAVQRVAKNSRRFGERNAVLLLIGPILLRIPFKPQHGTRSIPAASVG